MNILERIIEVKRKEIEMARQNLPAAKLEIAPGMNRKTNSLVSALKAENSTGIIAEFKRASPSRGLLNPEIQIETVLKGYADGHASGISVLTDREFFKGDLDDLKYARQMLPEMPLLRKEFIIDEYQLLEARAAGADVILLIAACLSPSQVKALASFAKQISLEVLLEIHNEAELDHITGEVDLVGVNNRDLKTFNVDINTSVYLADKIPSEKIRISESGISSVDSIRHLRKFGYQGFLIGEAFMKEPDPAIAFARFVESL